MIKGTIRVKIDIAIPREDYPELMDSIGLQPMFFDIEPTTKGENATKLRMLPPGTTKQIETALGQMAEVIRLHVHEKLPPEKVKELEIAKEARKAIEEAPKVSGATQIELYRQNPLTGEMLAIGDPILIDPKGDAIKNLRGDLS